MLWLLVAILTLTSVASLAMWRRDLAEIRRIVAERIDEDAPQEEIILAAREFLRDEVGYERTDAYFLAPFFSFMRPTALQVIREGGDCAYRTRAFIVTLGLFDIEATKIALYNDAGLPVHAVAEVETEKGPYYVDLLYNVAHEDASGRALALAELEDRETLRASLQKAAAEGNERASRYPLMEYDFEDWRTINWDKNAVLRSAYAAVAGVAGEDRARRFPRPYLSEEPALMVVVLCSGGTLGCLMLIWGVGRAGRGDPLRSAQVGKA